MTDLQITIALFLAAILVAAYTTRLLIILVVVLARGHRTIAQDLNFYILLTGYPVAITLFILAAKSF